MFRREPEETGTKDGDALKAKFLLLTTNAPFAQAHYARLHSIWVKYRILLLASKVQLIYLLATEWFEENSVERSVVMTLLTGKKILSR